MSQNIVEENTRLTISSLVGQGHFRSEFSESSLIIEDDYSLEVQTEMFGDYGAVTLKDNYGKKIVVTISRKKCNLGGYRYYFICTTLSCRNRTTSLFFPYLKCRSCSRLFYRSQIRNKFSFINRAFDLIDKSEELYSSIAKSTYRGRPTKKVQMYRKYELKIDYYSKYMGQLSN